VALPDRTSIGTGGGAAAAALITFRSRSAGALPLIARWAVCQIARRSVRPFWTLDSSALMPSRSAMTPSHACYTTTRQTLRSVEAALAAAGATVADVVRWTVAIVDGQPLRESFAAFGAARGAAADPPAISVHVVSGLANPRFLVEIDAIAVV
jgi:enamine deaminase RidA (YjgF/YER057c/UK114 family)